MEGTHGFLPQPEKDLESPSSVRLEVQIPYHDKRAMTHSPSPRTWRLDFPGATREALELPVVPCGKHHTCAAARENP